MIIIGVEGSISVGKSTFLNFLEKNFSDFSVVQEPCDAWQNITSKDTGEYLGNILDLFYKDPSTWACLFEILTLETRTSNYIDAVSDPKNKLQILFFERTVMSGRNVFAKLSIENKWLNPIEAEIYEKMYCERLKNIKFDALIHLDADPEICYQRKGIRGRKEEDGCEMELFKVLDKHYKSWYETEKIPVYYIDNSIDHYSTQENIENLKSTIVSIVDEIKKNKLSSMETKISLPRGESTLITGPMFAGKSTRLIHYMEKWAALGHKVIIVKYLNDTRFGLGAEEIATHASHRFPAIATTDINLISDQLMKYDVIGIDEGQFIQNLVKGVNTLVKNNKRVYISALNGSWSKAPFQSISELISVVEHIEKLTSICVMCQQPAHFSFRKSQATELEVIGAVDEYAAVCGHCFDILESIKPV